MLGKVGSLDREQLQKARDAVLRDWKVAKRAESRERIAQALDNFIDEIHPI